MRKCVSCSSELSGSQVKYCSNTCKQRGHYNSFKNNPNSYFNQTWRALKRKVYLIDQRGGGCQVCGYNKNIAALEFHHKDASTKESQLDMRRLSNSSMEFILNEFDKCLVLCSICHREHHSPHLEVAFVRKQLLDKEQSTPTSSGAPSCADCGASINYTHTRCVPCNNKFKRKVERPDTNLLQAELDEHGVTWCSKQYGVSRKSIHRWLK